MMGGCPLSSAISNQNIEKVDFLLTSGKYTANHSNWEHDPFIIQCLMSGKEVDLSSQQDAKCCALLKVMVRHGAHLDDRARNRDNVTFRKFDNTGLTPAGIAAARGRLQCLRFLHASGADLTLANLRQITPLLAAVKEKRVGCVEFLIKNMSLVALNQVDENGTTALMWATIEGSVRTMKLLIGAGADLNIQNRYGHTALYYSEDAAFKLLLEKGACVNAVDCGGDTLLSELVHLEHHHDTMQPYNEQIMSLLSHGADPTATCRNSDLLHVMVARGEKSLVQALVLAGCPPLDIKSCDMELYDTPLTYLDAHARISPLAIAICWKRPDIARYFIANRFFTRLDITRLSWDVKTRFCLLGFDWDQQGGKHDGDHLDEKTRKSLEILNSLSSGPQTLLTLSLVAVRSALTQDSVFEDDTRNQSHSIRIINFYTQLMSEGHHPWIAKPTFREKVDRLGLPTLLKNALLTQTSNSWICCDPWAQISIGHGGNFKG